MLLDLQDSSTEQGELDVEPEPAGRGDLMGTLDRLNNRFGRRTVLRASAGLAGKERTWSMKQNLPTPVHDQLERHARG